MPKEWGKEKPNISKFEKAVPKDHKELLKKLKKLAENWKHVDKCGVVIKLKAIVVDLGTLANSYFGGNTPDFYIPLKPLEVNKANKLIKALVTKVNKHKPLVEQDAKELFLTIKV